MPYLLYKKKILAVLDFSISLPVYIYNIWHAYRSALICYSIVFILWSWRLLLSRFLFHPLLRVIHPWVKSLNQFSRWTLGDVIDAFSFVLHSQCSIAFNRLWLKLLQSVSSGLNCSTLDWIFQKDKMCYWGSLRVWLHWFFALINCMQRSILVNCSWLSE